MINAMKSVTQYLLSLLNTRQTANIRVASSPAHSLTLHHMVHAAWYLQGCAWRQTLKGNVWGTKKYLRSHVVTRAPPWFFFDAASFKPGSRLPIVFTLQNRIASPPFM
jgi:hypothetical protein